MTGKIGLSSAYDEKCRAVKDTEAGARETSSGQSKNLSKLLGMDGLDQDLRPKNES